MTIEQTKEIVFKHLRNALLSHADSSMRTSAVFALLRFLHNAEIVTEITDGAHYTYWSSDWSSWILPAGWPSKRIEYFFEHSHWNESDKAKSHDAFRQELSSILSHCNFDTRVHVGICLLMLALDLGVITDKMYEQYAMMLHREVCHFATNIIVDAATE